jgi:hypothetical protein
VDKSGWSYGQTLCYLSFLRDPECRFLSPDGTLKMRIRFVHFGGIVGWKRGKDEELKGLKERTGDRVQQNMGTLLQSQALSDLKIETSDGKVFQAHKCILAGPLILFKVIYLS